MLIKEAMTTWRRYLLVEGRVDKAIKKYPDFEQEIRYMSKNDPSGNNKYLGWMAKQVAKNGADYKKITKMVQEFDAKRQRLDKKDIYQYSPEELYNAIENLGKSKTKKKEEKKEGAVKIYDSEDFLMVTPLTREASCIYGSGTKWCISGDQENMFDQYFLDDEVSFVFAMKKELEPSDPEYKIALVFYPVEKIEKINEKFGTSLNPYMPLEVYNAKDELSCKSQRIGQIIYNYRVPLGQHSSDEEIRQYIEEDANECRQFLESYFDGKYESKMLPRVKKAVKRSEKYRKDYLKNKDERRVARLKDFIEKYRQNDKTIQLYKLVGIVSEHYTEYYEKEEIKDINSEVFDRYQELNFHLKINENSAPRLSKFQIDLSEDNLINTKIKHIVEFVDPSPWLDTITHSLENIEDKSFSKNIPELTISEYNEILINDVLENQREGVKELLEKRPNLFTNLIINKIYENMGSIRNVSEEEIKHYGENYKHKAALVKRHMVRNNPKEFEKFIEVLKDIGLSTRHIVHEDVMNIILYREDFSFEQKLGRIEDTLEKKNKLMEFFANYVENNVNWDNPLIVGNNNE